MLFADCVGGGAAQSADDNAGGNDLVDDNGSLVARVITLAGLIAASCI